MLHFLKNKRLTTQLLMLNLPLLFHQPSRQPAAGVAALPVAQDVVLAAVAVEAQGAAQAVAVKIIQLGVGDINNPETLTVAFTIIVKTPMVNFSCHPMATPIVTIAGFRRINENIVLSKWLTEKRDSTVLIIQTEVQCCQITKSKNNKWR